MKEDALAKVMKEIKAGSMPKYPCGRCSPPKYGHYYGYCDGCQAYALYCIKKVEMEKKVIVAEI